MRRKVLSPCVALGGLTSMDKDYTNADRKGRKVRCSEMRNSNNGIGFQWKVCWFRLAVALLLLFPCLNAYAQFESASVLGYAKDTSGAAIPNSTITLTNTATGISQTVTTDNEGRYEFPSVLIGQYRVMAEAAGFERVQTEPLRYDECTSTRRPGHEGRLRQRDGHCNGGGGALETETSSRGQVDWDSRGREPSVEWPLLCRSCSACPGCS